MDGLIDYEVLNKLGFMSWGHLSVASQLQEGLAAVLVRPWYQPGILLIQTELYELVYWKTWINGVKTNRHELNLTFVIIISWLLLVNIVMESMSTEESERNQITPFSPFWEIDMGRPRRKIENGVLGLPPILFIMCLHAYLVLDSRRGLSLCSELALDRDDKLMRQILLFIW